MFSELTIWYWITSRCVLYGWDCFSCSHHSIVACNSLCRIEAARAFPIHDGMSVVAVQELHFLRAYVFIGWWTFKLLLPFTYCKHCYCEHLHSHFLVLPNPVVVCFWNFLFCILVCLWISALSVRACPDQSRTPDCITRDSCSLITRGWVLPQYKDILEVAIMILEISIFPSKFLVGFKILSNAIKRYMQRVRCQKWSYRKNVGSLTNAGLEWFRRGGYKMIARGINRTCIRLQLCALW